MQCFPTIQLLPYCTWLRRDMVGLLRAATLSVWLPNSSQCSMNTQRTEMHLSPLFGTYHFPPRMDAPEPGPRFSRHLWSATETLLCSGVGVPGLRREELIRRPTLDPLVPKAPRGGAWSGRGENRRHPLPRRPQAKGGSPRGGRQRPPTAVFTHAHLEKKPGTTKQRLLPTFLKRPHLSSNPEVPPLWKRK